MNIIKTKLKMHRHRVLRVPGSSSSSNLKAAMHPRVQIESATKYYLDQWFIGFTMVSRWHNIQNLCLPASRRDRSASCRSYRTHMVKSKRDCIRHDSGRLASRYVSLKMGRRYRNSMRNVCKCSHETSDVLLVSSPEAKH